MNGGGADGEPETAVPHPAGRGEQPMRRRGEEADIRAAVVQPGGPHPLLSARSSPVMIMAEEEKERRGTGGSFLRIRAKGAVEFVRRIALLLLRASSIIYPSCSF
ncbi:hypothetical protein CRG98_007338 [Punica granatum]|uniref:Uncharacterized protein n=1 Tax=Punica granatum TaxID=22663 RepID=A0A2I0KUX0_PUNGR|nr:hypothetical protein CRG98_007338 [Punica granatum]